MGSLTVSGGMIYLRYMSMLRDAANREKITMVTPVPVVEFRI